jgi:hypothetical protein
VLRYRLAGATDRSGAARSAGRAINRGAARNMMLKNVKQERDVKRAVADVNGTRKCRHYVKVMGPAFLSGGAGICVAADPRSRGGTSKNAGHHLGHVR